MHIILKRVKILTVTHILDVNIYLNSLNMFINPSSFQTIKSPLIAVSTLKMNSDRSTVNCFHYVIVTNIF